VAVLFKHAWLLPGRENRWDAPLLPIFLQFLFPDPHYLGKNRTWV